MAGGACTECELGKLQEKITANALPPLSIDSICSSFHLSSVTLRVFCHMVDTHQRLVPRAASGGRAPALSCAAAAPPTVMCVPRPR